MLRFTPFCVMIEKNSNTTAAHIKHIIKILNKRNIVSTKLSTQWENKYGCAEQ